MTQQSTNLAIAIENDEDDGQGKSSDVEAETETTTKYKDDPNFSNDDLENPYFQGWIENELRIELAEDIYSVFAVLYASNIWDKLNFLNKFGLILFTFYVCVIQCVGLILVNFDLTASIDDDFDTNSFDLRTLVMRILAFGALSIYMFQDYSNIYTILPLILKNQNIEYFNKNSKNKRLKYQLIALQLWKLSLTCYGMYTAIECLGYSESGLDAFGNSLAMMFLLEVDDWACVILKNSFKQLHSDLFVINIKLNENEKDKIVKNYLKSKNKPYAWVLVALTIFGYGCVQLGLITLNRSNDDILLIIIGYILCITAAICFVVVIIIVGYMNNLNCQKKEY